jgi:hypothetical protein
MAKAPNDPQPTYMKDDSTVDISVSDLQKIFLFLDRVKLSARLSSASKKDNLVVTLPTKTVNEIKRLVAADETARRLPMGKRILYPRKRIAKQGFGLDATTGFQDGCCDFSSDG